MRGAQPRVHPDAVAGIVGGDIADDGDVQVGRGVDVDAGDETGRGVADDTVPAGTAFEADEGFPDAYAVNTVTLDEVDGVTIMTTLVKHQNQEHRDGHLASGMEGGMQVSYNRLEDLVRRSA